MIWEAFEGILSVTSENKHEKLLHSSGVFLINKLLQAHMKLLYSSLSTSSKDSLVQSAFKLMTYMIAQDMQLLRDFALTFDFSLKGFRAAANRRNRKVFFVNLLFFAFISHCFSSLGDWLQLLFIHTITLKFFQIILFLFNFRWNLMFGLVFWDSVLPSLHLVTLLLSLSFLKKKVLYLIYSLYHNKNLIVLMTEK